MDSIRWIKAYRWRIIFSDKRKLSTQNFISLSVVALDFYFLERLEPCEAAKPFTSVVNLIRGIDGLETLIVFFREADTGIDYCEVLNWTGDFRDEHVLPLSCDRDPVIRATICFSDGMNGIDDRLE